MVEERAHDAKRNFLTEHAAQIRNEKFPAYAKEHRHGLDRIASAFYERLQYRLHSKTDSHARENENHARNQRDDHDAERKEFALDMVRGNAVPLAKDLLDGLGRRRFTHNL